MRVAEDAPTRAKHLALLFGRGLTVVALGFVVWEIGRHWGEISDWVPSLWQICGLLGVAVVYAAALFGLAANWLLIVRGVAADTLPKAEILLSYTRSQIAKYVPGNVFHLVGRHVHLKSIGLRDRPLALASFLEVISLPVAALLALLPWLFVLDLSAMGFGELVWLRLAVALCVGVALAVACIRLDRRQLQRSAGVLLIAAAFMTCQGALFAGVLWLVVGEFSFSAIPVAIIAWLVGYLTPGAPGGLGVREAVFLSILGSTLQSETVLLSALLFRIVTILGDVILYVSGTVLLGRSLSQ